MTNVNDIKMAMLWWKNINYNIESMLSDQDSGLSVTDKETLNAMRELSKRQFKRLKKEKIQLEVSQKQREV